MKLLINFMIFLFLWMRWTMAQEGTIRSELHNAKTAKEFYDSDLVLSCGNEEEIAVTSFHHGFKPMTSTCARSSHGDCLQESPAETKFTDEANGRSNAIFPTCIVRPDAGGTCDNDTLYTPVSFYSKLDYFCIPKNRIAEMCDVMYRTSPKGVPVYAQNRDYSSGSSIVSSDKMCNCSVEALSSNSGLVVYTLHQELASTAGTCHQTINMTDSEGTVLKTIRCEPPTYNRITMETLTTNFMFVNLFNTNSANAGKFWLGFEASDGKSPVRIECPAVSKIDCGGLEDPVNGAVRISCTSFGCAASYVCISGFSVSSGSVSRTCQEDKVWNGTQAVCTRAVVAPDNAEKWKTIMYVVSCVLGAIVAILIFVIIHLYCKLKEKS